MKPIAALLAACALTLAAEPPGPARYRLVSGTDLNQGIDKATQDLPFFERSYARHRLADVNPLYKSLRVAPTGEGMELGFDDRAPLRLKEGQDVAWTREDGETFSVGLRSEGRRFQQTYRGREGQRVNTFYVSPGGRTLILTTQIRSPKLGKALRYQLVYERED